jgi:hypothetical protein
LLSAEISKAYKLAHRDVPGMDELRMEAGMILKDCESIPDGYLGRSYASARVNGRSSVPTSKDIMSAWHQDVKAIFQKESAPKPIEYRPKHDCNYCNVVAIRLGVKPFGSTELDQQVAAEPVTTREIECVKQTALNDNSVFRHWNESPKSPYRGLLT